MSEIYNIYESSFKALSKKIDAILNIDDYNTKNLEELRTSIQEINRLVKQMQLEINNLKTTKNKINKEIEQNLKKYKNIVNEYNIKLVTIQEEINNINKYKDIEMKNKNILIDEDANNKNRGLIEDEYAQQEKINYIGRQVLDIETMGNDITDNLYLQTEQMKGIRDNVITMSSEADTSNSLIIKIINEAKKNKLIMYGLGVLVVLIFIIIMINKF